MNVRKKFLFAILKKYIIKEIISISTLHLIKSWWGRIVMKRMSQAQFKLLQNLIVSQLYLKCCVSAHAGPQILYFTVTKTHIQRLCRAKIMFWPKYSAYSWCGGVARTRPRSNIPSQRKYETTWDPPRHRQPCVWNCSADKTSLRQKGGDILCHKIWHLTTQEVLVGSRVVLW